MKTKIPQATAQRLPLYFYYLSSLNAINIKKISSSEISNALKFDATTVRRDFSNFGSLGKRGFGYNVPALLAFFSKVLFQNKLNNIIIIGVGNLGQALMKHNFKGNNNINIIMGFDNNPDKRKLKIKNDKKVQIPIYPIKYLKTKIKENKINIAILTVPEKAAQKTTDNLVNYGIKGILNFSPIRISVPKNIHVQNINTTSTIQSLIYSVESQKQLKK